MTRARRILLAVLILGLAAPGAAGARPNIVFIMTDDQTAESIRVMRNVRALLREPGTTFTQTITSFPLCCPSRATYLTGQYAHNHGVVQNAGPFGGYARLDATNTLPLWLQRAGYETIHVGRYLNGYGVQNPDITEIPPGWNRWISTIDPSTFRFDRWRINDNGWILQLPGLDRPDEYQTDYLGRRAAEEILRQAPAPGPFFLSLTFPAPHSGLPVDPGDPPSLKTPSPAPRHRGVFATERLPRNPAFDERDVTDKPHIVARRKRLSATAKAAIRSNYRQELESLLAVDDAVGTVVGTLAGVGELENTLIVFTSDNGFFHGEHRIRAEKVYPYDPAARVPMVMRGPGVPAGHTDRRLVSNLDWAPTIVDAADATPARLMDGTSLLELLADPLYRSGREIVLENGFGVNSLPRYRALRNDRFLWVQHTTTGESELYDRSRDPYELENLTDDDRYAPARRLLARRLRKLARCAGAAACGASRPRLRVAAACSFDGSGLRLALRGSEAKRVGRVRYSVGRRSLGASSVPPFRALVSARRLQAGRPTVVRALVRMIDGRVATYDRAVESCAG